MRNIITIIIVCMTLSANSQVIGNKEIITKTYTLDEVYKINIQMYAKVFIDMNEEAGVTITGESNIIDLIRQKNRRGELLLDQKKWIEPTQDIIIKIGAPGLREIEMGTHDKTVVSNVTGNIFKVDAPIGEVILDGEVESLKVKAKMGRVDASMLKSVTVDVRIKSDGEVMVNAEKVVDCDLNEEAVFVNVHASPDTQGCENQRRNAHVHNEENRFINLKIKNNSWKRNHFVVVGPKPNGRKFSYGFPLMPLQTKKERWTVGSKIYKENSMGGRTLLVTLTEEDEDQIVKLFE